MIRSLRSIAALAVLMTIHGAGGRLSTAAAQSSPPAISVPATREEVQQQSPQIASNLRSRDAATQLKTLETLQAVSKNLPRALADNLVAWIDPLLETRKYDDVLAFTSIGFSERAFDVAAVERFQEARVHALLGLGKLDEALSEAKSFYNVVGLKRTDEAIDLLAHILERQKRGAVATRLKYEQSAGAQADAKPAPLPEGFDPDNPELAGASNVLLGIKVDRQRYAEPLAQLTTRAGTRPSYSNLMARGKLLLLMDRAAEARPCFEVACGAADNTSSKAMREAIEGLAATFKAESGMVAPANAFITAIRNDPKAADDALASIDQNRLKDAGRQTMLAAVKIAEPAIETERAKAESSAKAASASLNIVTDFESGSRLRAVRLSPTRFKIVLLPQVPTLCDWFLYRIDGAAGQTIRIDIQAEQASLDKWWTLNPVWCTTENFDAPDSPSKTVKPRVPPKDASANPPVIPDTSGQNWHYIPDAWRSDAQTFSFTHKVEGDRVYVAMRVPYTPTQNETALRRLANGNPAIELIEIGRTSRNRPMLMAKIGSGSSSAAQKNPCMLIYAGEHADEPDGMWAARGAIEFLSGGSAEAKQLRERLTFLIIPQLDPNGSILAMHEGINTRFLNEVKSGETVAYANWFQNWVNAGNRLDLVIDLHNMQSSEMSHLQCWLMEGLTERGELSNSVHATVLKQVTSAGFEAIATPVQRGWSPARLGGWLARRYGPLCFLYELNSQAPQRHLTIRELKDIGASLAKAGGEFMSATDGGKLLKNVEARRADRILRWKAYPNIPSSADAIFSEAEISKGVGISATNANTSIEKWVP